MGVCQGMTDAAAAVGAVAGSGFQQIHINRRMVQNSGLFILEHIRVKLYPRILIIDKIFEQVAVFVEHHYLMNLAFE